jgi:putative protein-disulfide isomerase
MKEENIVCDPVTGECTPAELPTSGAQATLDEAYEIIYVGDPMCSWCWGIANHLQELKGEFAQYKFSVVVGGLRPGGGEAWDEQMKGFLRHHWEEVTQRSGQPFGYGLFDREEFNYDTEPPCRAVIAAKKWLGDDVLGFFEAVSRKFYVDNEDPGQTDFYQSICGQFGIPFTDFVKVFESEETRYKTHQDFQLNRQWGVKGYPTVLFRDNKELYQINYGYTEFDQMKKVIEKITSATVK